MADLASSAVTLEDSWYEGGEGSPRRLLVKRLLLVLTGQGTASNAIPASVLGFDKLVDSSVAVPNTNADMVVASPDYAQTSLLLKASASDAPADFTGHFRVTVRGT